MGSRLKSICFRRKIGQTYEEISNDVEYLPRADGGVGMKTRSGYETHIAWEKTRGDENECDAENKIGEETEHTSEWWNSWLERSDSWRDEIGHEKREG